MPNLLLRQVRAMVTQAEQLDHRFGGGFAREVLAGQLRWAVGLLGAHVDPSVRDELYSEVGELAVVTAWSSHDVGADAAAQRCHHVALHFAEQANNWEIHAETLADMARIAQYHGDGESALTLAHQSMVRSDRLTPLRRACLLAVEARAHGKQGNAESCLAAVRRTEEQFAAADPANETPAMVAFSVRRSLPGIPGTPCGRWPCVACTFSGLLSCCGPLPILVRPVTSEPARSASPGLPCWPLPRVILSRP